MRKLFTLLLLIICWTAVFGQSFTTCWEDKDGDGYGNPAKPVIGSDVFGCPIGTVDNDWDCDDNNPDIKVGFYFYLDQDNDGYIERTAQPLTGCTQPPGPYIRAQFVKGNDCDDNDAEIRPDQWWYLDSDYDLYPDGGDPVGGCYPPPINGREGGQYVSYSYLVAHGKFHTDCSPFNPLEHPNQAWYEDQDHDGYPSIAAPVTSCTRPPGLFAMSELKSAAVDCNDNEPLEHPGQVWYEDRDNDGYSTLNTMTQCSRPLLLKAQSELKTILSSDCNDNDATIHPDTKWYFDADNDGYYGGIVSGCSSPGTGYTRTTRGLDCNDNDATIHPETEWYIDSDNDGYYTSLQIGGRKQCESPGAGWKYKGLLGGGDCDDNDAEINPATEWYWDADNDGYYTKIQIGGRQQCTSPGTGWKYKGLLGGGDCDDNDATYNPETVWVIDQDGDGYYTGDPFIGCLPLFTTGYIRKTTQLPGDCHDNDPAQHMNCIIDADHDGVADANDCAPNDATKWRFALVYTDTDGDSYADDNLQSAVCYGAALPAKYILTSLGIDNCPSINNPEQTDTDGDGQGDACDTDDDNDGTADANDCAASDATKWRTGNFYADVDGDGYGAGSLVSVCYGALNPAGYSNTNTDCNDANPAVHENCVTDSDHDGVDDANDCDPQDATKWRFAQAYLDADGDGYHENNNPVFYCYGNSLPTNYVLTSKGKDNCPSASNPDQKDTDGDGQGDACDTDDDNDGTADANDCAPLDATKWRTGNFYADGDGDGYGAGSSVSVCYGALNPAGYSNTNSDCKDNDKTVYPDAPELCDGKDNNCNNQVDEGGSSTYYRDADGDGYGDPAVSTTACAQPTGYVTNKTDCKDNDKTIYPGAPELCDGKDNDCDGQTDEGGSSTYYRDADGDGYGNPNLVKLSCSKPSGYVSNKTDCDDTRSSVYPGAPELCDGRDNNCNGQIDEGKATFYRDADGDGYGNASRTTVACSAPSGYVANKTDCDDTRSSVYPGAPELCDGRDNNCNGQIDEGDLTFYRDADGDRFGNPNRSVKACAAPEGYVSNKTDCDDSRSSVYPGAPELCDGRDNNCNGQVDEVSCNTCGNATSFSTTNITSNSARLNWIASSNPQQWQLRYRSASGWIWIDVLLTGSSRYYDIKGLSSDKDYRWQLRAKCGNNWTDWSTTQTFTTSRRSNTQTRPMPEMAETKEIQFGVMPNPSNTNFRITLSSNDSKKPVKLVVTDMSGRVIETRTAVAGQTITIGDSYKGGTYIVNIVQGSDRRQMKLVKVN